MCPFVYRNICFPFGSSACYRLDAFGEIETLCLPTNGIRHANFQFPVEYIYSHQTINLYFVQCLILVNFADKGKCTLLTRCKLLTQC